MIDLRNEIIQLAEKSLYLFTKLRFHDLNMDESWKNGLKKHVEIEYTKYRANYENLHEYLKDHDEQELTIDHMDITALATLINFHWDKNGIYNVPGCSEQLLKNHILSIRDLRNTLSHYPQNILESELANFYFDQLYHSENLAAFAVLLTKYKSLDTCKEIYHSARHIIDELKAEHWLVLNNSSSSLHPDEDMSALLLLAERGNIEAQLKVGREYENGTRVKKDFIKAFMWFYKAALSGNPEAQYYIGTRNLPGIYNNLKPTWIEESAKQGYAPAQYQMGLDILLNQKSTEADNKEMFTWFKLSADQNYPEAIAELGNCYLFGTGINKDTTIGKELLEKAANLGYTKCYYNLAKGAEFSHDFAVAIEWYSLLSKYDNKYERDINRLKSILSKNTR